MRSTTQKPARPKNSAATPRSLVERHWEALHISSELTRIFRRMHQREAAMIGPEEVIAVLHEAGINCVLMGTHGLGTWRSQPRATQDVDVLVTKKDMRKAVRVLRASFPGLQVQDGSVVTRFLDPATGNPVIDVLKPTQNVFQIVFRYTIAIGETHRIPDLEMALASKFAAMVSPRRDPDKKLIDGGDFVNVVRHNRADIDLAKLKRLGNKVCAGGGDEMLRLVDDIDEGRPIRF